MSSGVADDLDTRFELLVTDIRTTSQAVETLLTRTSSYRNKLDALEAELLAAQSAQGTKTRSSRQWL